MANTFLRRLFNQLVSNKENRLVFEQSNAETPTPEPDKSPEAAPNVTVDNVDQQAVRRQEEANNTQIVITINNIDTGEVNQILDKVLKKNSVSVTDKQEASDTDSTETPAETENATPEETGEETPEGATALENGEETVGAAAEETGESTETESAQPTSYKEVLEQAKSTLNDPSASMSDKFKALASGFMALYKMMIGAEFDASEYGTQEGAKEAGEQAGETQEQKEADEAATEAKEELAESPDASEDRLREEMKTAQTNDPEAFKEYKDTKMNEQLDSFDEDINKKEEEVSGLDDANDELKKQKGDLEQKLADPRTSAEEKDSIQDSIADINADIQANETKMGTRQNRIDALKKKKEDVHAASEADKQTVDRMNEKYTATKEGIDTALNLLEAGQVQNEQIKTLRAGINVNDDLATLTLEVTISQDARQLIESIVGEQVNMEALQIEGEKVGNIPELVQALGKVMEALQKQEEEKEGSTEEKEEAKSVEEPEEAGSPSAEQPVTSASTEEVKEETPEVGVMEDASTETGEAAASEELVEADAEATEQEQKSPDQKMSELFKELHDAVENSNDPDPNENEIIKDILADMSTVLQEQYQADTSDYDAFLARFDQMQEDYTQQQEGGSGYKLEHDGSGKLVLQKIENKSAPEGISDEDAEAARVKAAESLKGEGFDGSIA